MCWQMHYLLYGSGMQTWEYSPLYAIRSYAYLWLHALPACLHAHVLQTNKVSWHDFTLATNCSVSAVCPDKQKLFSKMGRKGLYGACLAGIGVLLCAMCLSVRLLCLWTLFLQVSSLSKRFNVCAFSKTITADFEHICDTGQFARSSVCTWAVWCWRFSSWAQECSARLLVGHS